MIKVGLTGNIGSGKTTIAKIFETLNVPVFYSDIEAKKLYQDENIKSEVADLFGSEVLDNKDDINLKALSHIIFSDKKRLLKLENIIHPRVHKKYYAWLSNNKNKPYTIIESALLLKSDLQRFIDIIISVNAPISNRIERVMQRDQISKDDVLKRMNNQLDEKQLKRLSDFIIDNSGEQLVIPQVLEIHSIFNHFNNDLRSKT